MRMPSISEYLHTLEHPFGMFRTLGEPVAERDVYGKIKFRAWHRFWAWISFLVSLVLFGVFCWSFGFSALTVWFLLGAGANFVRAIFLCFFKKDKFAEGGLQ